MWPSAKNQNKAIKSEVIREFCANSSIHGVRYLDSTERTSYERLWWMIVFLLSIAGCSTMIFKAYIRWDQNPIIVSFSEKTTPVREVQFPAVTICPETKVQAEQLNFTEEINGLYDKEEDVDGVYNPYTIGQLKAISQVCASQFYKDHLSSFNGTGEMNVVNILKNLSLDRDVVVDNCGYGDEACDLYMKDTVTEAGLCYSFNMLPQSQMFRKGVLHNEHAYVEDWDTAKIDGDQIPLHALGTGTTDSLWMYLATSKTDIDYTCAGDLQGFTMTLHEASAYPTMAKRSLFIPLDHRVQIAVKPQIITTSPSAAEYHWSKRQCFFNTERYLQFFKIYNQDNCELECLTNITLAVCGCVRYSMPRAHGSDVCSFNKLDCMNHAVRVMGNSSYFNPSIFPSSFRYGVDDIADIVSKCNCLPACTSIQYDVEVTQTAVNWKKVYKANRYTQWLEDMFISSFDVYFKESQFIASRRSELYGIVDFIANCGGLLGLFMGFSILSLLEICYFITIRPISLRKIINRESDLEAAR